MLYNSLVLECVDITSRWVCLCEKVRIREYKNSLNIKRSPTKSKNLQKSSIFSCYRVVSMPVVKQGLLDNFYQKSNLPNHTLLGKHYFGWKMLFFHNEI